MRIILLSGLAAFIVLLASFFSYLAFVDIPAPTARVDKVLPDARFPK
jgi:hypothetical protein